MNEVVTYEAVRKGEKISPELLVKYIELKLEVLDLWIKKLRQFFVQIDMALNLLERHSPLSFFALYDNFLNSLFNFSFLHNLLSI